MKQTDQKNQEMNCDLKKNCNSSVAQLISGLTNGYRFTYRFGDSFGFLEFPDGEFDLIAVDTNVEKFVPLFQKDPSCCGMI